MTPQPQKQNKEKSPETDKEELSLEEILGEDTDFLNTTHHERD